MTLDTRALPAFANAVEAPFTPPGRVVPAPDAPADVAVYVTQPATDAVAAAYHSRLQVFTLWFVDGARYIELDDPRWRVYYLFQRTDLPHAHRLLGFITTCVATGLLMHLAPHAEAPICPLYTWPLP